MLAVYLFWSFRLFSLLFSLDLLVLGLASSLFGGCFLLVKGFEVWNILHIVVVLLLWTGGLDLFLLNVRALWSWTFVDFELLL